MRKCEIVTRADFKLVTHPEHQPAVDFITRSAEGPFVDTGVSVQHRLQPGMPLVTERVYLSVHTIKHLSQLVGLSSENVELHQEKLLAQGKVEYIKEDLGGRVRDLADLLSGIADAAGIERNAVAVVPAQ